MKIISSLCLLMLFASCSTTYNKNHTSGNLDVKVTSNLEADVNVDMSKKISGQAQHSKLFGLFNIKSSANYVDGVNYSGGSEGFSFFSGGVVEDAKSAAAFNAIQPAKADIIVAPQYLVKVESWFFGAFKEVTAQVTGYAGYIRNIKPTQKVTAPPLANNN